MPQTQVKSEINRSMPRSTIASRSCKEETSEAVTGEKIGEIPKWLKGCLLRNGPGMMDVGEDKYKHWFCGLALLQNFKIQDGEVTYQNRFLRSESFKKNMAANRIVVSEFGTVAHPDPCSTLFDRFKSNFYGSTSMTDNDNVNIVTIGDRIYASTETNLIRRIDPNTLESKEQENISRYVAVNTATAHTHTDNDGTVYNLGNSYKGWPSYNFIRFPPSSNNDGGPNKSLEEASLVCQIPSNSAMYPSYYHSFGISENYIIFVEQPLNINLPKLMMPTLLLGAVKQTSYFESMYWDPKQLVRFHVAEKRTGKIVPLKYQAKPFFVFHHVNAYEEEGHLVVDLCAYENGLDIVTSLSLENLKSNDLNVWQKSFSQVRRFILPLPKDGNKSLSTSKPGENLISLNGSSAVAYQQKDGSILCDHEVLSTGLDLLEMPRINYERYNTKKYRYVYGLGKEPGNLPNGIIKLDVEQKKFLAWYETGKCPTEPIFVPKPDAKTEDDGIILSSLLHDDEESKVTLVILDALNLKEIARVRFNTKSAVTNGFHGPFVAS